jgi:hypothetical protein
MTLRRSGLQLAAILLTLLSGDAAGAARPGQAAAAAGAKEGLELARLVAADSFKSFGSSTEGTVLARFASRDGKDPLGVWVYERGSVHAAERARLDRAFSANRAKWPPYTLLFVTHPEGEGRLRLELSVRYDQGLGPESRGGYEETWHLRRRLQRDTGGWSVVKRETTLYID